MARMIDQIRAGGRLAAPMFVTRQYEREWVKIARRVNEMLRDPDLPVLVIDNVSDYYYSGTDQEYWDLRRDFPNLAPPYPMFWVEHRLARRIHSADRGDADMSAYVGKDARAGILVTALDPKDCKGEIPAAIAEQARWYLWCELFINYGRDRDIIAQGPHGSIFLAIDAEGGTLDAPWMQTYLPKDAGEAANEAVKSLMGWLHPTFLAISFLHCKNVRVEDHAMDKPLAKKFVAKHRVQPVQWKTLVIEPLKQILRSEGKSHEVGLARAMHICRGHFKDYRTGGGLFGKYHQLVWQPSIVRGTRGAPGTREIEVRVPSGKE